MSNDTKTAEERARELFTDESYRVDLKRATDIEGVFVIFYSLLDQIEAKATKALKAHAAEARREGKAEGYLKSAERITEYCIDKKVLELPMETITNVILAQIEQLSNGGTK